MNDSDVTGYAANMVLQKNTNSSKPTARKTAGSASKAKKAAVATEKLGPINEETDAVLDSSEIFQAEKKKQEEEIQFFNSFVLGQGSLYVLEGQNKQNKDGKIGNNGPKYLEREWNARQLQDLQVKALLESTADGTLLYTHFQEHALTFGISGDLLKDVTLAPYRSNDFPVIVFKDDATGKVLTVNGHHRIEADRVVHRDLLDAQVKYHRDLAGLLVTSDHDTPEIIEAREKLEAINLQLYNVGQWGVIFIDMDVVEKDPRKQDIMAYFSRNPVHFHYPDNEQDLLHLLLKSVHDMTPAQGFQFLEDQLKVSDKTSQRAMRQIIKNPRLLFIFSDLMAIPMFAKTKLITYNSLSGWRYVVPCWMSVFMGYARDSYKYLAFTPPPAQQLTSILDIQAQTSLPSPFEFGFLDSRFHTIIDDAYKTHLAACFLSFGSHNSVVIQDEEVDKWAEHFEEYQEEVLEKLEEWVSEADKTKKFRPHLKEMVKRITYLLNTAYKVYPYICKLNSPLPLACETFIRDIGKSLHANETGILEFFALFEPSIAIRYGRYKKTATSIDLLDIFQPFATIPANGIESLDNIIPLANVPDFDENIAEIWASIFSARGTGISALQSLSKRLEPLFFMGPKATTVKAPSETEKADASFNVNAQITLGLFEVLYAWIRAQRKLEDTFDLKQLSPQQKEFLENDIKRYGCVMPPSLASMPDPPFKFTKAYGLDTTHQAEIKSCLDILRSSYYAWACQLSSSLSQHTTHLAIKVFSLNKDKTTVYQHYLGENAVWDLYCQVFDLVKKISPHFVAWHGITTENWEANKDQIIVTQNFKDNTDIDTILGAGMADQTTTITRRYQVGIPKIIDLVHSVAAYHNPADGKSYVSQNVSNHLESLIKALAQESVHQTYQFEQIDEYAPLENLNPLQVQAVLQDRLKISYPGDLSVMREVQRHQFYGSDGVLNTYQHLIDSSHGVKSKKEADRKAQIKAQQILDRKAKKRSSAKNSAKEDDTLHRLDSPAPADLQAPPPNQLAAQKRPRASSVVSPQRKKPKRQGTPPNETGQEDSDAYVETKKSKGKKKELVLVTSTSDIEMEDNTDHPKSLSPEPDLENA